MPSLSDTLAFSTSPGGKYNPHQIGDDPGMLMNVRKLLEEISDTYGTT